MKLELKHIAPYPMDEDNGLLIHTCTRTISEQGKPMGYKIGHLTGISERSGIEVVFDKDDFAEDYSLTQIKPIFHPLSDLTKEIEVNGEMINVIEEIYSESWMAGGYTTVVRKTYIDIISNDDGSELIIWLSKPLVSMYWVVGILFKYHFDIFGLIKEGLAIDINTINDNEK